MARLPFACLVVSWLSATAAAPALAQACMDQIVPFELSEAGNFRNPNGETSTFSALIVRAGSAQKFRDQLAGWSVRGGNAGGSPAYQAQLISKMRQALQDYDACAMSGSSTGTANSDLRMARPTPRPMRDPGKFLTEMMGPIRIDQRIQPQGAPVAELTFTNTDRVPQYFRAKLDDCVNMQTTCDSWLADWTILRPGESKRMVVYPRPSGDFSYGFFLEYDDADPRSPGYANLPPTAATPSTGYPSTGPRKWRDGPFEWQITDLRDGIKEVKLTNKGEVSYRASMIIEKCMNLAGSSCGMVLGNVVLSPGSELVKRVVPSTPNAETAFDPRVQYSPN